MTILSSNPATYRPKLPDPVIPSNETMLRHHLAADDVLYMGATDMGDGRTMLVFEQGGQRRSVAVRGSIQELNHDQTEREIERSRKRHLHAEACLETIYRPSSGGIAPCRQTAKEEPPASEPATIMDAVPALDEPLSGASGAESTRQEFVMPVDEPRRVIGEDDVPPLPAAFENVTGALEPRERPVAEGW